MRARDGFGYASEGAVDSRFMPEEAVSPGGRIELTDQARGDQPGDQRREGAGAGLADCSIPLGRASDPAMVRRPGQYISSRSTRLRSPRSCRLPPGEVAVVLHGAIPNANGAPVVDRWAVVIRSPDGTVRIEEVGAFLERTRLAEDTPSRPLEDLSAAQAAIPVAVDRFQTHLVELRKAREADIQRDLDAVLDRLSALETRFQSPAHA
jgi:hypothetical protein